MAASISDFSTFKSALKKEKTPDFTITCGDYSWRVHSHLFAQHSKAFKAIFEEGATQSWTTNDTPVIIAHMILWCYSNKYGDLVEEAMENNEPPPEIDIDELMKHGLVRPTRPDGSARVLTEEDALFMPADKEWIPEGLHAQMYLLASKYGLTTLKDRAALEIEVMLTELDFDKVYFLPMIGGLFGVKVDQSNVKGDDDDPDCITVEGPTRASTTPDTVPKPRTPTPTPIPRRSRSFSPVIASETHVLCPKTDTRLWEILAEEAATKFDRYQSNPVFQVVMTRNPQFNWDVTCRMQKKFAEMANEVAKKQAVISGLEGEKTKVKRPRKRKEKEMSAS
ncbi:hypothetical protein H2200_009197 [Cladophialophora chaetospira]|uniref:BTB domain-containing protein n=1 Tax=Cladophialophora chaetospira TaxID=386627 RepID=A0AA39CFC0_9EURO|nr:hypothetical protein H2200_009197 [Cladophialophora chaetospira]